MTSNEGIDPLWVLRRKTVRRIGVLRLWQDPRDKAWYVSLDNNTYHNIVGPISEDKLPLWKKELGYKE